jgi:hypothetical protein
MQAGSAALGKTEREDVVEFLGELADYLLEHGDRGAGVWAAQWAQRIEQRGEE